MKHGYNSYASGCRCDVCRKAKADYMRARRAAGRAGLIETAFTHGTRSGYEEHGCRCPACKKARAYSDHYYYSRRRSA